MEQLDLPDKPEEAYRILHTADWHLGKTLSNQSRESEHSIFLAWLLETVVEKEIDAILLAGDVFDAANPPESARRQYYDFVSELHRQSGCALVVIGGNHDSASQLESPRQVLRALNTHVAGGLASNPADRILHLPDSKDPKVAIALVPFLRDRDLRVGVAGENAAEIKSGVVAGIEKAYAEAAKELKGSKVPAIATGHLTVANAKRSDSEREIHIGGLGTVNGRIFPKEFDYVALGHIHRPQVMDDESGRIRYSGSPLPLSFSESEDDKSVRILDITDSGIKNFRHGVPLPRRLSQIRTTAADLERAMVSFKPRTAQLPTWVEVIVEDSSLEENIVERVAELAEDRDFEVLVTRRDRHWTISGMSVVSEVSDEEAIEAMLDHPEQVLQHLLEARGITDKEEVESLHKAFVTLVELDDQQEREEGK